MANLKVLDADGNAAYLSVTGSGSNADPYVPVQAVTITDGAGAAAKVEARAQTPTGNALNVQIGPGDVISNIPVMIDFEHHQVHEGETHKALDAQTSLGTGTVKYGFTVATYPDTVRAPHLVIEADVYDGAVQVLLYEDATFTGGTVLTPRNRNRNSATAPASSVKTGVTSTNGTLIDAFYAGAGTKTAGVSRASTEWLLKSNTIYRIDVIGLSATTKAYISFNWYEDLGV